MQPSNFDPVGHTRESGSRYSARQPQDSPALTRSFSGIRRLRSDESWVEVSSQPSSSSLSSVADEVITTGLRVQNDINARRRRRLHRPAATQLQAQVRIRSLSAAGSSQEEYEESESESDRIMSSSNEDLHPGFHQEDESPPPAASSEEGPSGTDDDENSTALGIASTGDQVFTPQPNAFSHPPSSRQTQSTGVPGSYFPALQDTPTSRSAPARNSYPMHRSRSHTPYTMLAPSYTADHDAALRASLSTLLSCAAAARGLPKRESTLSQPCTQAGPSTRVEPSSIRMLPESALPSTSKPEPVATTTPPPPLLRRSSSTTSSAPPTSPKGKRKSSSRDRREVRKKARALSGMEDFAISPTLMTWVVSAGVVVLFSAISFSAGYAYGKEMGYVEGAIAGSDSCAREASRAGSGGSTFRRLRWGNASVVRV